MEEHLSEIIDSLRVNLELCTLILLDVGIIGIRSVETILNDNTTLVEVNLPYDTTHMDGHPDITKEFQYLVHTAMLYSSKVISIRMFSSVLQYDHFTENQTNALKLFLCNAALQTLKVTHSSHVSTTDNIMTVISDCLQINNSSLQELIMNHSTINNEGLTKLSVVIQINKALKRVDLSNNEIADDGVAAISQSIMYNSSVQELNISQNMITSKGAKIYLKP